jgi:hypothetical protein
MHDGYFWGPWWEHGKRECLQPMHSFLAGRGSPGSIELLIPYETKLDEFQQKPVGVP